jgi:hypothetical protein
MDVMVDSANFAMDVASCSATSFDEGMKSGARGKLKSSAEGTAESSAKGTAESSAAEVTASVVVAVLSPPRITISTAVFDGWRN